MARLRLIWAWLDVPAGSVLGCWSGAIILLTIIGFIWPTKFPKFPEGAITAYIAALGSFTVGKNFGKASENKAFISAKDGTSE